MFICLVQDLETYWLFPSLKIWASFSSKFLYKISPKNSWGQKSFLPSPFCAVDLSFISFSVSVCVFLEGERGIDSKRKLRFPILSSVDSWFQGKKTFCLMRKKSQKIRFRKLCPRASKKGFFFLFWKKLSVPYIYFQSKSWLIESSTKECTCSMIEWSHNDHHHLGLL